MTLRFLITATLTLLAAFTSSAAASTITIDTFEKLTGATGVDVGGTLYDVAFVDASCASIFSGCDALTDFEFTTVTEADLASQALLDQVLLDGPNGSFDTMPGLTLGCGSITDCFIWTPYGFDAGFIRPVIDGEYVKASVAANRTGNDDGDDVVGFGFSLPDYSFAEEVQRQEINVYADWTPSASPVPEPASFALIAAGLAGLAVRRWRQRKG